MDDFQEQSEKGAPRELQHPDIIEALGAAVRAYDIELVARRLRKSPGQLYAEVNRYGDQRRAKLSFDDALEAMRITKNFSAFALAAALLGFRLVAVDCSGAKPTVAEELTDDMRQEGLWAAVCMDEEATEQDVELAAAELHKDIDETKAVKLAQIRAAGRS